MSYKKYFFIFFFLPTLLFCNPPMLILNASNQKPGLPKNFTMYRSKNISTSGQFSKTQLHALLRIASSKQLFIIDLREESHGFVNGHAVSFHFKENLGNQGKTRLQIEQDEKKRLMQLQKEQYISINVTSDKSITKLPIPTFTLPCRVQTISCEKELCKEHHTDYLRLPIGEHMVPSDQFVDQLIKLTMDPLPNTLLHFHDSNGIDRTTMILQMMTMMNDKYPLDLKGAEKNLPEKSSWKYPYLKSRLEFLKKFNIYCKEQKPSFKTSWSKWKASQKHTQAHLHYPNEPTHKNHHQLTHLDLDQTHKYFCALPLSEIPKA